MISKVSVLLACASALSAASPVVLGRAVDKLNQEAFEEAHQRDETATRALSDVKITTPDGQCLFVDPLSGDFRANLNPIQVAPCGSTDGQGWDVITEGKHNDKPGTMLIVNTLTQACVSFDQRKDPSIQVHMFSCGGRADGSGEVTNSQLFALPTNNGATLLWPTNADGLCLTRAGDRLVIATCNGNDAKQIFALGGGDGAAPPEDDAGGEGEENDAEENEVDQEDDEGDEEGDEEDEDDEGDDDDEEDENVSTADPAKTCGLGRTRTVTITQTVGGQATAEPAQEEESSAVANPTESETADEPTQSAVQPPESQITEAPSLDGIPSVNPTEPVPVSRAGGTLNPESAAEAHQRDEGATRAFTSVSIKAPNGQCLFVDPTAGDFRQNLIPLQLVDCSGTPNEKFDIITAGKHNNAKDAALVVSSLMNGCMSFDGRRQPGDTVTVFSCGGRAAGEGETNSGQLIPFSGGSDLVFSPVSENGKVCLFPKDGRIDSSSCTGDASQVFTIVA